MSWWSELLWGLFGGALVVGLDFVAAVGRLRGSRRPPNGVAPGVDGIPYGPYLAAALVRIPAGGGLAVAVGSSGFGMTPLLAVGIGIGAPLMVEKLGQVASDTIGGGK